MSGIILSYISEFLPLVLGVTAFLLLRSISISSSKIRIWSSGRASCSHSHADGPDITKDMAFKGIARDMLIVRGLLPHNAKADLEALAFSKLGFIRYGAVSMLAYDFSKTSRLSFFSYNPDELAREIVSYSRVSGILLQYLLNDKLEMVVG